MAISKPLYEMPEGIEILAQQEIPVEIEIEVENVGGDGVEVLLGEDEEEGEEEGEETEDTGAAAKPSKKRMR